MNNKHFFFTFNLNINSYFTYCCNFFRFPFWFLHTRKSNLNILLNNKSVPKLIGYWFCTPIIFKFHSEKKALIKLSKIIGIQNPFSNLCLKKVCLLLNTTIFVLSFVKKKIILNLFLIFRMVRQYCTWQLCMVTWPLWLLY